MGLRGWDGVKGVELEYTGRLNQSTYSLSFYRKDIHITIIDK